MPSCKSFPFGLGIWADQFSTGYQELFKELCHPDWAANVVIEEPQSLKVEYERYLKRLALAS